MRPSLAGPHQSVTSRVKKALLLRLTEVTNRSLLLPLAVFYPTSRCNSRCVSCDWWKSSGADDLSVAEIRRVVTSLAGLGTELVVFSGGEPLLRPDVFALARLFRNQGMSLHLLTSGVLLERCAAEVANEFVRVIVSLDAASESLYQEVRGVAALAVLERGVSRLRRLAPRISVSARATLHRMNFREMPRLIDHAKAMGLDGISFLAADVSSSAFGGPRPHHKTQLALTALEVAEFDDVIARVTVDYRDDLASGFVVESADKLRRLPRYYAALLGGAGFPSVACNAPWISIVIEADGAVRPCFFHGPIGSVRHSRLEDIVARNLPTFRATLDVATNATCARCVCSMKTSHWKAASWAT
jgi:MoaA/NifB/PqqE/SkfB family radical SAM enzyme